MAPPSPRRAMLRLLPLLLLLVSTANADDPWYTDCPSDTNYSRGGVFQGNLDAVLSFLPATAASAASGLATNATGAATYRAYGLAQCRADVNASDCRVYLDAAARDMASRCPGQKTAMLIYDGCMLRHSNARFFGAANTTLVANICNSQNATQPERFRTRLGALMSNLTGTVAYASPRMFAVGAADFTPFTNIYGMAQWTRDLAADDCNLCLNRAVSDIPTLRHGKQGGLFIFGSCSIRFELYLFYNAQAAEAAMLPLPPTGAGGNCHDPIFGAVRICPQLIRSFLITDVE